MRTSSASRNASRKNRSLEPRTRGERAIVVGEKFSCWESWWWLRACRRACVFRCESERQGSLTARALYESNSLDESASSRGQNSAAAPATRKQQEYPLKVSHSQTRLPALTSRFLTEAVRGPPRRTCASAPLEERNELARGPPRACCAASPVSP